MILKKIFLCLLLALLLIYTNHRNVNYNYIIVNKKIDYDTIIVTATCYLNTFGKITASGHKYPYTKPIIAVSHDLLKWYPLHFGKKVKIEGTNTLDGWYYIEDLMSSKYTKKIDIMIDDINKGNLFKNVKLIFEK